LVQCYTELIEYFEGRRQRFSTVVAPEGTPFQLKIWQLLRDIPYGQTISYAQLAVRAGNPRLTRAVGFANSRNPIPIIIPCHRVIGSSGHLVGFAGGLPAKHWLLQHEQLQTAPRLF